MPTSDAKKKSTSKLMRAVRKGDAQQVEHLLSSGEDVLFFDQYEMTPLILAARKGRGDICALLVGAGADLNARDRRGRTAVYLTVLQNKVDTVKRLLELGADANVRQEHGWSPLDAAKSENNYDMCRLLMRFGAKGDPPDPGSLSMSCIRGVAESNSSMAYHLIWKQVQEMRSSNPWNEKGCLLVSVHISGDVWKPDHLGVRVGRLWRKHKLFDVTVGLSDRIAMKEALEAILLAFVEGWRAGMRKFHDKGIEFDSANVRIVIETIARTERLPSVIASLG